MAELVQGPLARHMRLHPAMSRIQGTRTFAASMDNLAMYAKRDTLLTAFLDGGELVACAITAHAHRFDYPLEICERLGIPAEKMAFRTHIYVRPDQRGKGLSLTLQKALTQQALDAGKTHIMAYAFETQAIYEWAKARPEYKTTGIINPEGHDVLLNDLAAQRAPDDKNASGTRQ